VTDGNPDQVAVSVLKKSGGMWISSGWTGLTTVQKPLISGNVTMN
jgi:hypothetical protein